MVVVLTGLLVAGATSGAQAQQPISVGQQTANPSGWTFDIAPYLWLPSLHTTLNYNLPPALNGRLPTDVPVQPADILTYLNFAMAFAADAQYGPFSLLTDFMCLNLSDTTAHIKSIDFVGLPAQPISRSVQASTGTRLSSTLWTLAGGYTVIQGELGQFRFDRSVPLSRRERYDGYNLIGHWTISRLASARWVKWRMLL